MNLDIVVDICVYTATDKNKSWSKVFNNMPGYEYTSRYMHSLDNLKYTVEGPFLLQNMLWHKNQISND